MYYWVHVHAGTEITSYGPFTEEQANEFRSIYADDDAADGSRKDIDDLPPLPGTGDDTFGTRDNQEEDTWIAVRANSDGRILVDDSAPIMVQRAGPRYETV